MHSPRPFSRRRFLKLGSTALGLPLFAACTPFAGWNSSPPRNGISGAATPVAANGEALLPQLIAAEVVDLTQRFQHFAPLFAPPGMVAAWTGDEGGGYRLRDISGQSNDAYFTGTQWVTRDSGLTSTLHGRGLRGGAVLLNGTQWLQVQQRPELQPASFSASLWLKPVSADPQTFLAKGDAYTLTADADGALRFSFAGQQLASEPAALKVGRWQHIAVSADATSGQLRLYRDSVLIASVDHAPFAPPTGESDLCIGGDEQGQQPLHGAISEVSVHNVALSADEVTRWYALGMPTIYRQTRETIDTAQSIWTTWKGNEPIPHPIEEDTLFTARYNGSLLSDQGVRPQEGQPPFVPASFGAAIDTRQGGLRYASPIRDAAGTFEAWVVRQDSGFRIQDSEAAGQDSEMNIQDSEVPQEQHLFRAEGREGWLELGLVDGRWQARLGSGDNASVTLEGPAWQPSAERALHVALSWGDDEPALTLWLNGVAAARAALPDQAAIFDQRISIGGDAEHAFQGAIDDVRISSTARSWGNIYPRGQRQTLAASLDLRDYLDHAPEEPLHLWRATGEAAWRYTGTALSQQATSGLQALFHPDAYGHMSSIEAGLIFETLADGWAGVFVQAAAPDQAFSAYSFALNPQHSAIRLAAHQDGAIVAEKILPYDFPIALQQRYTLTLTSADDGVLRGYIDGNSLIALAKDGLPSLSEGFSGLFTENTAADFATIHFSALTPANAESRQIEQRLFVDGQSIADAGGYSTLELSAFRWQKWPAALPWRRGGTYPEPPGALFGPMDNVERANPAAAWRSEDSANSDLIALNGTIYYFMRGNPRIGSSHGPAAIGLHSVAAAQFDGRHFVDQNGDVADVGAAQLLRGNPDSAPDEMRDRGLRRERFQVNDQGSTYIGDGRIVLFAREFRNRVGNYPWYRRLGYGIYDVANGSWQRPEIHYVAWSAMEPDNPAAQHQGLDATPEVVALRDAANDEFTVFLLHHQPGTRIGGVSGLVVSDSGIDLDERYPQRDSYVERNGNVAYGERVFFDNGIYYLHYNAASDASKMGQDWPDRFHLAASLHPYEQRFINSADNAHEEPPYFGRGEPGDFDNAAIWQGCMFKHEGRYYLYYEAYHAISSVDTPYEAYDDINAGSRAGFATG